MKLKLVLSMILGLALSACATMERPRNAKGSVYAAQQGYRGATPATVACHAAVMPEDLQLRNFVRPEDWAKAPDLLSAGDRLRLTVSGDKDHLTGSYVIAADGAIQLLGGLRFHAEGKNAATLESEIERHLIARGLIRGLANGVRLTQTELSGASIAISGAVFEAGTVRIGERQAEVRSLNISNIVSGDMNAGRTISAALRAAGGVRPDADPQSLYLVRGRHWTRVDMSGALNGRLALDLPVTSGDRVIVPSVGCLQEKLVRPSMITAPGIRVFLSNLSRPASSNASSAIGKDSTSLPYGTRFLQALVSANCVGGSAMNAGRSAVLISRNPATGQSIVISRSIERLVRDADRDAYDPYLMPGDAVACYDSRAMNLRDVISTVSEAVTPYALFQNAD